MAVAIANARQTVPAPVRKARRFGLFSVVDLVDGGDAHWLLGGFTADGEECSAPSAVSVVCGPTAPKSPRSWYSDITSDPWVSYMYETCKTVGRYSEAATKLKARFLAAEQSAVEAGFQTNTLTKATAVTGTFASIRQAIGALEAQAAADYGGQIILHVPFSAFENAALDVFVRVGDHLETAAGNLVAVGNYNPALDGGSATSPVIYATGATTLYRGPLVESGPTYAFAQNQNDYYTLIERPYGALVDCLLLKANGTLCGCGGALAAGQQGDDGSGDDGDGSVTTLDEGDSMSAVTLGIECGDSNADTAANLNTKGVVANPQNDWGSGHCAFVDCGGDIDHEVRWNGDTWVGC